MRARLIVLSVAVTTMVVVAFFLPLAVLIEDLAEDRAVGAAEREANSLARIVAAFGRADDPTIRTLLVGRAESLELGIAIEGGEIVGSAVGMTDAVSSAFEGRTLRTDEAGGVAVYVPVAGLDAATAVRAWVGPEELRRDVERSWLALALLGALLVGLAAVLADRLGRTLVAPVVDLAAATERLSEGDLDVTIKPSGPKELVAVGRAFNRLARSMHQLLEAERETVADLSHRLRTPLMALRLDIDAVGDAEDAERLRGDVDRVQQAVDSVIQQARRPIRHAVDVYADLVGVVSDRLAFWQPLALDQRRAFESDLVRAEVIVKSSIGDVGAAVDALLENVFSHTPEGSRFSVEVTLDATLIVSDRGPGFGDADLVERGVSGAGGTGLGLDIVRRTAEASGGSLAIGSRQGGGSQITMRFGVPD